MFNFKWRPLSEYEEKQVVDAVAAAELNTSGEIRIHLDKWCKTDPLFKARNIFDHLKMTETKLRNGVLVYVAVKEKKFAIVGDEGIDSVVPDNFWESTKDIMSSKFQEGSVADGISLGVEEIGVQLKKFFPYQSDDVNELPDEISYG